MRYDSLRIQEELKKISLPNTYVREGKACFFDAYRQKLIEITPEETVRQKVAKYCEAVLGVPPEVIKLEEPISHYVEGVPGRADIIIHQKLDDEASRGGILVPVAVIECKNESVFLTDQVADQAIRYCRDIGARYFIVTNGVDLDMAVYEKQNNTYRRVDGVLDYSHMVNGKYHLTDADASFTRFSLSQLADTGSMDAYNLQSYPVFGFDTPDRLKSVIVNLFQGLMDCAHKLPVLKGKGLELVDDIGVRFLDYSNAGAGHYAGDYRSFLVKDRYGEAQILSMALFGTDPNFRGEHRVSYTSLVVSIDRFKTSHNSLQYNIDRFSKLSGTTIRFPHNGVISSFKSADVADFVRAYGKSVTVDNDRIQLGSLPTDRLIYLDDPAAANTIYAFLEYAMLREEVRRSKRKKD